MLRRNPAGPVIRQNLATGRVDVIYERDFLRSYRLLNNAMENDEWNRDTLTIVEGDPLSAQARSEWSITMGRGQWRIKVETLSTMSADATSFYVTNVLDAYEGNTRIYTKSRTATIPRDHV